MASTNQSSPSPSLSSLSISQSSHVHQTTSQQPVVSSQTTSQSSTPSHVSQTTSPCHLSPETFLPGLCISPSSSPKQSYTHSPYLGSQQKISRDPVLKCQQRLSKSKSQKRNAKRMTLTHQDEDDSDSQPTDLSTIPKSRQRGITGMRRGEREAMTASM